MPARKSPRKSKRPAAPAKASRSRRPAPRPRKIAGGPPVTLAEARALASARAPQRARGRRGPSPRQVPVTPATVGAERERLVEQHAAERARRVREYAATMAIMKARGARRPAAAPGGPARRRAPGAPLAAFAPLQIVAEGDSWFDYPLFIGGGIVPRLENRLGVPILNLAKAGDEVRFMLGVEQRRRLAQWLHDGCPAGGPWDVLLFSGGGNDIVDDPMALWIRDWQPGVPAAALIHQPRFDAALAIVRAGYEDLIDLRDRESPTTHLVFHGYDFAIPDGRGVCHLGPWLAPTFALRGFPNQAAGAAVVVAMLQQFATMLAALATRPGITFINAQGTLPHATSAWHNELHPQRAGFDAFADRFHAELRTLFPTRVA